MAGRSSDHPYVNVRNQAPSRDRRSTLKPSSVGRRRRAIRVNGRVRLLGVMDPRATRPSRDCGRVKAWATWLTNTLLSLDLHLRREILAVHRPVLHLDSLTFFYVRNL